MATIKIIVADDHSIVRFGICAILNKEPNMRVIAEANDGNETLELYKKHQPDIVLLDISMPGMDGFETCKAIKSINPLANVVFMTIHLKVEYLNKAIMVGAKGYLLKDTRKEDLIKNIELVMKGDTAFSEEVLDLIKNEYINRQLQANKRGPKKSHRLTKRERQILKYVLEGYTNQNIAKELFISTRTVETHRANLMNKLNVNNTAALIKKVNEMDLMD